MPRSTSKKKKTKKPTGASSPASQVLRSAIGEGATAAWRIGTVAFVVVMLVGWVLGVPALRQRAADGADLVRVGFTYPTAPEALDSWVPPLVRSELEQIVKYVATSDPFDHESLMNTHTKLMQTGWFVDVRSVRRVAVESADAPNVVIDADWRLPRAIVEWRGEPYIVGTDSVVMERPLGNAVSGLPIIERPLQGPPMAGDRVDWGQPWVLDDVRDGIALLDLLQRTPVIIRGVEAEGNLEDYVARVDVRDQDMLVVTTKKGARVVWGGAVGTSRPGEVTAQRKAELLATLVTGTTHNRAGQTIDIRDGTARIDMRPSR